MEYSLLAVDLDGTLLNSKKEIDQENVQALHDYKMKGGKIVICSGRSPLSTRWIAETIGLDDAIISFNGAVLQEADGKILEKFTFKQESILTFLNLCDAYGAYAHLYEGDTILVPEENKWNKSWIENNIPSLHFSGGNLVNCEYYRNQCQVKLVEDFPLYVTDNQPEITKVAVFHENNNLHPFASELKPYSSDFEISTSFDYANLEITASGVTKAFTLLKLVDRLGFSLSEVAAIGDNYNDLAMLKESGLGIAMGNAPDEVKQAADAITETNEEAGVAKAIRKHLLPRY